MMLKIGMCVGHMKLNDESSDTANIIIYINIIRSGNINKSNYCISGPKSWPESWPT